MKFHSFYDDQGVYNRLVKKDWPVNAQNPLGYGFRTLRTNTEAQARRETEAFGLDPVAERGSPVIVRRAYTWLSLPTDSLSSSWPLAKTLLCTVGFS